MEPTGCVFTLLAGFAVLMLLGGGLRSLCGLVGIAVLALLALWSSGRLGRNKMHRTSAIKAGADVVEVAPKSYKFGGAHYEVKVKFSDGSWYRTEVASEVRHSRKYQEVSCSEYAMRAAVMKAVEAHEGFARAK